MSPLTLLLLCLPELYCTIMYCTVLYCTVLYCYLAAGAGGECLPELAHTGLLTHSAAGYREPRLCLGHNIVIILS